MALDSIGPIAATTPDQYSVAVTQKAHSEQAIEGQDSILLIQSASAPPLAAAGSVGTKLNLVA